MKKILAMLFPYAWAPRPHDDFLRANQGDHRPIVVSPWIIR